MAKAEKPEGDRFDAAGGRAVSGEVRGEVVCLRWRLTIWTAMLTCLHMGWKIVLQ